MHPTHFYESTPDLASFWRGIILLGRNSASYKFALGQALLKLAESGKTFFTLDELAVPYVRQLCAHLRNVDTQGTAGSSRFLDACRAFNSGELEKNELVDKTVQLGFANVLDAFHVVNQAELAVRFFDDQRRQRNGIELTDQLFRLTETGQFANLGLELEARWRLVEEAWSLGVTRHVLTVEYDSELERFFLSRQAENRVDVTSSREALNGYQKGRCFYCFDEMSLDTDSNDRADIDHFYPHRLSAFPAVAPVNLDGVWNLVLACQNCNRGEAGKFARVPARLYLDRLERRNEYLILSNHPLRETLINQTGSTPKKRQEFLRWVDSRAISLLFHRWSTQPRANPTF